MSSHHSREFHLKYPRTTHIEGSLGKHEDKQALLSELPGEFVVVEEKLDGTQLSIRFEERGRPILQTRNTILTGGPQEEEFNLAKPWVHAHANALWERLGRRFVMYGEWLYAKHTVFYDTLPHYFLEFDIYDRETQTWLSTSRRHELLQNSPILSVPVLFQGPLSELQPLEQYLAPSLYKSKHWKKYLEEAAKSAQVDTKQAARETINTDQSEGLYLKSETTDETVGRYKFIRPDFLSSLLESGSHWRDRRLIANKLREDVDLYHPMF